MSKEEMKLEKGSVVYMKRDSGIVGYGNVQCVSWVSHEIGELSLYGHNEHYKTYDVREIISSPSQQSIAFANWLNETNWAEKETWGKHDPPSIPTTEQLYSLFLSNQKK